MMRRLKGTMGFGRRAFLRGVGGLAIALPFLEATHGRAMAAPNPSVPKRFIVVFRHGGTLSNIDRYEVNDLGERFDGNGNEQPFNGWLPKSPGEALEFGPIHSVLEPHKSKILLPTAVDDQNGVIQSPYLGAHGWANKGILTQSKLVRVADDQAIAGGPSIDQVLAQRLAATNPVPVSSVNLMVDGHQYGTPFHRAAAQPIDSETNPGKAFTTYFKGISAGQPDPELVKRQAMGLNVLDGTIEQYKALQSQLTASDRQVVDAHLTHLDELEKRIRAYETITCTPPTIDASVKDADQEHVGPLMIDIIVGALRCGLTQVATLELADIITSWLPTPYGPVGYDIGHSLHHIARDAGKTGPEYPKQAQWIEEMKINRSWDMGLLKLLLDKLDAVPEGNGTMLDNSLVLHTSEFSNGSLHSQNDMPLLLAGSAGGYFRTGRHINCNTAPAGNPLAYRTNTGVHNLYTSILNAFGFPDTHFGADTPGLGYKGPIPNLTA